MNAEDDNAENEATAPLIENKPYVRYAVHLISENFHHLGGRMIPSDDLLIPDSSDKALMSQQRSSSSQISSTDSSTTESSFPTSSPSESSGPVCNPQSDLTLPSSSSSSFSLIHEVLPISEPDGPRWRGKKNETDPFAKKPHKHNNKILDLRNEEGCKKPRQWRSSVKSKKESKGFHDNRCCKCMAGFMVDCAAVCCCPLALLNLAALTFVRLPIAVARKMLMKLKNRMYSKRRPPWARDVEEESPRPKFKNPWPYGSSPEENVDLGSHRTKFDSQKLREHFDAGRLEFGSLSIRRDL